MEAFSSLGMLTAHSHNFSLTLLFVDQLLGTHCRILLGTEQRSRGHPQPRTVQGHLRISRTILYYLINRQPCRSPNSYTHIPYTSDLIPLKHGPSRFSTLLPSIHRPGNSLHNRLPCHLLYPPCSLCSTPVAQFLQKRAVSFQP